MEEGTFEGTADLTLHYRAWRASGLARAVIVIVPGFNAHSGYYDWVATEFAARGITAYAVDLRGRGKSEGERFYVETFADYADDVTKMVTLAKSREPGLPVFMLGHSAGGVVSCLYALDHQAELAGLVCESFAYQVPAPDVALSILKGLSHLAPHAHVLRLKNEDFSRDARAVAIMNADPLIANEVQPSLTVAEMVRADERLTREFPRLTLPLLILHGTLDKATRPSGSQSFYEAAGSQDKTLKLYEGYFHDPLNDLGKEQVMADVLAWLEVRLGQLLSKSADGSTANRAGASQYLG
ncbi:MAG: lysophospholipase [Myxococcales bacterium]|jgi:alpha-beta hydrolase superfamily lysophospholipase